jgi:hypothetical protein
MPKVPKGWADKAKKSSVKTRQPAVLWKTISYAFGLWIVGLLWGLVVFFLPALSFPPIPFVSKFPAVSSILLPAHIVLLYFFAKKSGEKPMHFGSIVFTVNFLLDILVYFFLFRGADYFSYLSIWLSYVLMFIVPRLASTRT